LLGLLFSFIIDSNTFAASDDDSSSLDENDKSSIENKNFSKRPYLRDILSEFSDPENERPVWFNELFGLRGDNDIVLDTQTLNEKIEINEEVFKNVTTEIDQTILIENNKDQHITPNLINDVDSEEDFFF
jgi:hypothetical protein